MHQVSHTFSINIFHTFSTPFQYWKKKTLIPINDLHFSKILFTGHNAKNIGRTVISGKGENLNEQMDEFGIFILFEYFFLHFGQIQYILEVLKTGLTIQDFFNTFNIARWTWRTNPHPPTAAAALQGGGRAWLIWKTPPLNARLVKNQSHTTICCKTSYLDE